MNYDPHNETNAFGLAKPYLQGIFKNVSFPTAHWSNFSRSNFRDSGPSDVILYNNSRTGHQFNDCDKTYFRWENVESGFSDMYKCAQEHGCVGKRCWDCAEQCGCGNIWVTIATGANYPDFQFIGDVLPDIIRHHLQFTDEILDTARSVIRNHHLMMQLRRDDELPDDHHYVGVHVRRTDYQWFSKFWISELLNETFFHDAMSYIRSKHDSVTFVVVSDDVEWCRQHLHGRDVLHIGPGNAPAVDMAIMSLCDMAIVDYGTFSLWGAILSGGEVVISKHTFRDARWAADYFGWTYI